MTSSDQLYEIWSRDSELRDTLKQSLEPRGTDWLLELFASLGPNAGDVLLDAGCRDAKHSIRLAREHGLRGYALDPLPLHVEQAKAAVDTAGVDLTVLEGRMEELPLEDGSVDWVWCRDVLVHVDVSRALSECARVLRPGGRRTELTFDDYDALRTTRGMVVPNEPGVTTFAITMNTTKGPTSDLNVPGVVYVPLVGTPGVDLVVATREGDANPVLARALARLRELAGS